MEIYVYRENEQFGPYPPEIILEYLRQGVFQESDLAWQVGQTDWKPVGEMLGLTPANRSKAKAMAFAGPQVLPSAPSQPSIISRTQTLRDHRRVTPVRRKRLGAMIAFNLVLVLIISAAAYVRFGPGGAVAARYLALGKEMLRMAPATPQAKAPVTTPTPVAKAVPIATPVKLQPAATVSPVPTPKPFDLAELAANPDRWPKTVILKEATAFPAVYQSKVIGYLTVPRGAVVHLVGIRGNQLALEYNGGGKWLFWKLTNIEERARQSHGQQAGSGSF
jgi:hypothetical protein